MDAPARSTLSETRSYCRVSRQHRPSAKQCPSASPSELLFTGVKVVQSAGNDVPRDDIPPRVQIFGSAVLISQVVGVLPHIASQQSGSTVEQDAFLVGQREDLQLLGAGVDHEKCPARTELLRRGGRELLLECVKTAEVALECVGQSTLRCRVARWPDHLPEELMVGVSTTLFAHGLADLVWHLIEAAEQIFDDQSVQLWVPGDRGVEFVDISLVMLVVVRITKVVYVFRAFWESFVGVSWGLV